MLRRGHVIAIMVAVLVAFLYPSPAYAHASPHHNGHRGEVVVDTKAGPPHLVSVKAGTLVIVLGLMKPGNRPCPTCTTYAVVQLPNGDLVALGYKAVNYQTQTVRVDAKAFGPMTPAQLKEVRWLPGTGGTPLMPLVGAVMLIGGGLILRWLLH